MTLTSEVGLPLHFHTFPAVPPSQLANLTGTSRRAAFFTVVSSFQMNLCNIMAAIIGALILKESFGPRRIAAAAVVTGGAVLLQVG